MPSHIEYISKNGYVSLILKGEVTAGDLATVRKEAASLLSEHNCSRLLVDATELARMQSIVEDFEFVSRNLSYFPPPVRIAEIANEQYLEHMQFVEDVSQNRGIDFKVFTDRDEAIGWLLAP